MPCSVACGSWGWLVRYLAIAGPCTPLSNKILTRKWLYKKLQPQRAGLRFRGAKGLGGVCFYTETFICVMRSFCNIGKGWQRQGSAECPAVWLAFSELSLPDARVLSIRFKLWSGPLEIQGSLPRSNCKMGGHAASLPCSECHFCSLSILARDNFWSISFLQSWQEPDTPSNAGFSYFDTYWIN